MAKDFSKKLLILLTVNILLLSGCQFQNLMSETPEQNLSKEALATKDLLEQNLEFSENEDIDGYLSTIDSSSHHDTRLAMVDFFDHYDVSHQLVSFEMVDESTDQIVAKAEQITRDVSDSDKEESTYRSHKAKVLHTFTKIDGQWKITESAVTDVEFID